MKTRTITHIQVLGAKRAERFLWDLANFEPVPPEAKKALRSLFSHYPDIFVGDMNKKFTEMALTTWTYRNLLRKAWDAPDLRRREWYLHELRAQYYKTQADLTLHQQFDDSPVSLDDLLGDFSRPGSQMFAMRIAEPSAVTTPMEEALLYLRKNLHRARLCTNKDCARPYFLRTRKGQKFCGEKCSAPSKRAAKLRWWHENRGKKAR